MTQRPTRERGASAPSGRARDTTYPPAPEALPIAVADSHCHLDIKDGQDWLDVKDALGRAASVGVDRIVQIGCDVAGARWAVDCAHRYDAVVAAVALHPNEAPRLAAQSPAAYEEAWREIEVLAVDDRVRAVGETGLDYFRTGDDGREVQQDSFRRHIALAKHLDKPLVIHDRDAHDDVLRVLDDAGAPRDVVMHCFSGDAGFAQECVDRGFHLSFAGVVTFKNAVALREALAIVPLDRLLVETDAPYLTPSPYRGRPNASYLIPITLRAMAQELDRDLGEVAQAISDNSDRLFGPWRA